jgi:hypothetical protein
LPTGVEWPQEWHLTHNPKHWSNEDSMITYFEKILLPYKKKLIRDLDLPAD